MQAIKHEETRVNNPTADAFDLVTEAVEAAMTWRGKRDFAKDPQLVWKGKDEQDREDLEVPAPPIFRQERIEPRYLVKQLMDETKRRRESEGGESAGEELSLFGTEFFDDGIPDELDKVDWYNHQMNWTNRMILGDSLQVMASLAERENLRGKVQMVYIDPPYGIKFGSNWQARADNSRVRDGKMEDATREVEQIKAFRDTWESGISSYLSYLRDRLIASRDLLTESGSIFLQIGDENVHLVRALLDEVFGSENFVSLITYKTTSGAGSFAGGTNVLAAVNNYVIWYAKDLEQVKYRPLFRTKALGGAGGGQYTWVESHDGNRTRLGGRAPEAGEKVFRPDQLTSQTTRVGQTTVFPVEVEGKVYTPSKGGWKTNVSGMERLLNANRLMAVGKTLSYVRYLDDFPAFPYTNLWDDTVTSGFADPKVYVVQTNTKVIERCMLMATDPGDLVLDPTCGSGTTAYVAEQWGRRWITIDSSRVAIALARHRIMGAKYPAYLLADSPEGKSKEAELSQQPLDRSPSKHDVRRSFVYERIPHITLKSIANNPDIKEGMTRDQIDKAIKKHAEFETLYDRPYENKKAVRVAGPFTVESLSPHRSVSFDQDVPASEKAAEMMPSGASYEETILEHVKKAGVQNGYRNERLEFESVEPVSGRILTAVGIRKGAEEGTPTRVGIALGPEYGTVDSLFIKNAAREALRFGEIDLLLILGFAFDANATEATNEINEERGEFSVIQQRQVGKMTVLNVRMNPDLAMGDELANTGAGNLFTVFGEPDIEVTETSDGQLVAEIKGLDIYNPTTGDVRAEGPDDIMMWSIDTDYDAEAFIVRHVYFSGENGKSTGLNPYERLGKALKGQIDEEALATLFTTKSRPFPKPESGRIAVKVVNYYGDEVLKAIEV
ncbi:site-specific DNA-methyltransferase [Streptomyces griseofuscus]|uniref:site-specific DNA-methyltransferase n=1 Tax=Streptomyces griseofuscus TaxID=146922 RepID=UPI0033E7FC4E